MPVLPCESGESNAFFVSHVEFILALYQFDLCAWDFRLITVGIQFNGFNVHRIDGQHPTHEHEWRSTQKETLFLESLAKRKSVLNCDYRDHANFKCA